jgi:hypothetical protein
LLSQPFLLRMNKSLMSTHALHTAILRVDCPQAIFTSLTTVLADSSPGTSEIYLLRTSSYHISYQRATQIINRQCRPRIIILVVHTSPLPSRDLPTLTLPEIYLLCLFERFTYSVSFRDLPTLFLDCMPTCNSYSNQATSASA